MSLCRPNKCAFGRRCLLPLIAALALMLIGAMDVRADWVVRGDASSPAADGVIEITPPANNQVGAAWLDTPVDLAASFDITLVLNLGDRDGNGADGLALVFQNDSRGTNALGDLNDGGRWIGMHGIYPALAVEIDTWYNTENGNEFHDIPEDHAGIDLIYNAGSLMNHAADGPVQALSGSANIEDGADHLVRLLWNSTTTTLTVYIDGVQRLSYSHDIVSSLFGGSSQVWFGVVGSTGGAYNRQQFKAQLAGSELSIGKSVMPSIVAPAGTVTYTVTVQNNSTVTAIVNQIEDQLPAGFDLVPGTTSGLTTAEPATVGQTLTWDGLWTLDPGQTGTLSFQVQCATTPGTYANTATVRGSNFADTDTGPTAQVTVSSGGPPPASGTKQLYLYSDGGPDLSRTPPAATQSEVQINRYQTATWTLTPALAAPLTLNAGTIPIALWLRGSSRPWVDIDLYSPSRGVIGTVSHFRVTWSSWTFTALDMTIAAGVTLPAGDTLQLRISNSSNRYNQHLYVQPFPGGDRSHLDLDSQTVINVDSVLFYDAPYAGGSAVTTAQAGQTVSIRAQVSDPFGSFDISSARLILTSPSGDVAVDTTTWTQVIDSGGATRLFEYLFTIPTLNAAGQWQAQVTAEEGSEGLVRHTNLGTLQVVAPPNIMLLKSVNTYSDPVNGSSYPKAIPGAFVTYTITAGNHGGSSMDSDTVVVIDPIPAHSTLYVGDLGQPSGPVAFIDTPPLSGLSFNPATDLSFSMDGGSHFNLGPADLVADADGCDARITHIRVNPKGVFNGVSGAQVPEFTLQFRVRVQ